MQRLEKNEKASYPGCQGWWLVYKGTSDIIMWRVQNLMVSSQFHVLLLIKISPLSLFFICQVLYLSLISGRRNGPKRDEELLIWNHVIIRTKGKGWIDSLSLKRLCRVSPPECTVDGREGGSHSPCDSEGRPPCDPYQSWDARSHLTHLIFYPWT